METPKITIAIYKDEPLPTLDAMTHLILTPECGGVTSFSGTIFLRAQSPK